MAIVVNTNIDSLRVQRNLNSASTNMSKAVERLTTGSKVNQAADDAAGFVIAKGLEAQQRGSVVAQNNAQTGINLLQTAEGNLDVIQDHLLRIRDLTLQAMNGGYSYDEVKAMEDEVLARTAEIDRISNGAKFNEFELFPAGGADDLVLQIGSNSDEATNTITVAGVFIEATTSVLTGRAGNPIKFTDGVSDIVDLTEFRAILDDLDTGIKEISTRRGTIGAITNRLESAVEALDIQNENLLAAKSRIVDADIGEESSNYTKYQILQQASASLLVQANQSPSIALSLI
ncbi:TPA: flagellin FliC [Candidatus Galligastranaerophilus intestinavium]|uniref:Flagellin n=1 Tax=Candidatus Galligastranaerophilus intestinavium TaxID=2840836 RepID=A0A9D1JXI2_9BACT|nr:flagellin FliC [Candidatus Galligastranaerophilus intestinavium]